MTVQQIPWFQSLKARIHNASFVFIKCIEKLFWRTGELSGDKLH
jgi:hypothetical protein